MHIKAIAPLAAAALILAACSGNAGQKETAGTIIGGIGGAVLGSQIAAAPARLSPRRSARSPAR